MEQPVIPLHRGDLVMYDESDLVVETAASVMRSIPMAFEPDDSGKGVAHSFCLSTPIGVMVVMEEFKPMSGFRRFFNGGIIEVVKVRLLDGRTCFVAAKSLIKLS